MKKRITNQRFIQISALKNQLRMKLTIAFLFLMALQINANISYSQNNELSLKLNNVSIEEAINIIEKESNYSFLYSDRYVNVDRKVNINIKKGEITDILNQLFINSEIEYNIVENQIILSKSKPGISDTQQNNKKRITGKVVDQNGEAIIGANVIEKGTTNGTVTNVDGYFSIEADPASLLQFSFIGYHSQEATIGNKNEINIILEEDLKMLDEVVVVGYGTQKKGEVASAITTVKSENFVKVPAPDAAQMIRGQVPGLAIVSPGGDPTATSQILLRGVTTLKASASPLIIIDGIPGELNTVSPEEIDQIDVLKDGSAAAIYGTRGTNGVIIITTKNAKGEMPTTVDVNAYLSTQQITRKLDFMTYDQYMDKVRQGKPGAQDNGGNVDWLDEILQTPLTQVYNISLRGGSRNTNYTASFEYRGLEGIIKKTNNQMIYPRIEITHRMFENKLRINASLSGYQQKYNISDRDENTNFNKNIYRNALTYNPTDPIKDANGNWTESPSKTEYFNPLALLWEAEGENLSTNLRMFASATFTPIEGLDIKYLVSSDVLNQTRGYYETKKHISTIRDNKNGYADRRTIRKANELSELTAQYNKTIGDHSFTVLAGYSWLRNNYQKYFMENFDFPSDDYSYNKMQDGQALKDGRAYEESFQSESKLIGYFGRLNYSYMGKYMLTASIRHEGSTKFGANHKWGTFPAVSGAWNIAGEDFMRDQDIFSTLKLRAGFGITGTEPTDPYKSLNTLSFSDYIYYNGEWIKSVKPNENPNPDLRWEKKEETNIGLDFGFFNERLTGSIDYYIRKTKDLIWGYTVPSPPYLYPEMQLANAGSMENKGFEITLRAVPVENRNFQWITDLNFSTNKNKLLTLSNDKFISSGYADEGNTGEPMQQRTHRLQEGQPIGNFYGYKSIDIDDDGHWIIEGADGNPKPISQQQPTDKKILGNGIPKHYLNWNNSIHYKNIDFGVTMRGAFGFQILNMPELQYAAPVMLSRGNIMQKAYENVYGKRPLADDQELQYVSYYIEDGDYWKIDNVTVGYTFNFNNKWIQRLRVYGSINNLAVITGYGGIDPEVNILGNSPGCDDKNRYPAARTYTLGVSFKF